MGQSGRNEALETFRDVYSFFSKVMEGNKVGLGKGLGELGVRVIRKNLREEGGLWE